MIKEAEELPISPINFGSNALHAQRHEIDEKLRQQRATDPSIPVVGVDANRIQDRSRFDASEFTKVDASHDEAD